ncbi:MAG: zf-HC2 domain-containing protein [Acidobacteria bacterium]|nr:zf-HC2 domain-containing protein [Acidobacteriota bacterium]
MECLTCTESLTAFMDGELSPAQAKKVESHFTQCTLCHDDYQSLLHTYQLVEQVGLLELDPNLWTRIHSEITDLSPSESTWLASLRSLFGIRWVPIAAGTLGVVFLSLFFVNQPNPEIQDAFDEYVREREQLELPRVRVSQNASSLELRIAYPNPFIVSDNRPQENPFKLE